MLKIIKRHSFLPLRERARFIDIVRERKGEHVALYALSHMSVLRGIYACGRRKVHARRDWLAEKKSLRLA